MLFGDLPRSNAGRLPQKIALVDGDSRLTWAEVDRMADRLAAAVLASGIAPGARIGLLMGSRWEWAIACYGAARAGVALVPFALALDKDELVRLMAEADIEVLIADEASARRLTSCGGLERIRARIVLGERIGEWLAFADWLDRYPALPPARTVMPDDELIVLYSSGSTGRPKGVVLTHRNAIAIGRSNVAGLGTREDDIGCIYSPVSHKGAFHINKLHAMTGGTVVFLPSFDARTLLATIHRESITNIIAFPSVLEDLRASPDRARHDVSSLRRILIAGTVMTRAAFEAALEDFPGVEFQHCYGLTDAGGLMTTYRTARRESKLGSVGRPMPGCEVELRDPGGKRVPAGETGEIACRAESLMKCYLGQAALTARTLRDGWLHTGDLGRFDADGDLWVVGRMSDLIRTGAESVAPIEVEELLASHPAVLEVAVFGVPDPRWGEAVTAAVALRPGAKASERELIEFCSGRIAPFKRPKRIHFFDALPKNAMNAKVLKTQLREQLQGSARHA